VAKKKSIKKNEKLLGLIKPSKKPGKRYEKELKLTVRQVRMMVSKSLRKKSLVKFQEDLDELYNFDGWKESKKFARKMIFTGNREQAKAFYTRANQVVGFNLKNFVNEEGLEKVLKTSVKENVESITDLKKSSQRKIERILNKAFIERTEDVVHIKAEIMKSLGADEKQAKFIARDQTQRLMSSLNRVRQEAVGIKRYKWITSRDERVRPTHKANHGKIFEWDNPDPETGHPGHDYNCRCSASPIIEIEELEKAS